MHRHNRKYGHNNILAQYCGVAPTLPILGEVQHSLFLSTHHFKAGGEIGPARQFGALGAPLFSWNLLLPVRNQIAIGDPLLYSSVGKESFNSSSDNEVSSIPLVMPKLNEELSQEQRLSDYLRLIDIAREVTSSERVTLSVHPSDVALAQRITRSNEGVEVYQPIEPIARARDRIFLESYSKLNTKRLVVSDYFGAHVFRASAYFGSKVHIDSEKALNRAIHPNLRPLLLEFLALPTHDIGRPQLSREILGSRYKREPSDLKRLLYRPDLPALGRKIWVASYKYSRRAKVQVRKRVDISGAILPGHRNQEMANSLRSEFPPFNHEKHLSRE